MSLLLVNVRLYSQVEVIEINETIVLSGDDVRQVAEWCQVGVAEFICEAIEDRLWDVQSAMGEERKEIK